MGRRKGSRDYTIDEMYAWADYLVENDTSLGGVELHFKIDRRVIWKHFKDFLEWHDPQRFAKVREVLERNKRRTGIKHSPINKKSEG